MAKERKATINVQGMPISILVQRGEDYIAITQLKSLTAHRGMARLMDSKIES